MLVVFHAVIWIQFPCWWPQGSVSHEMSPAWQLGTRRFFTIRRPSRLCVCILSALQHAKLFGSRRDFGWSASWNKNKDLEFPKLASYSTKYGWKCVLVFSFPSECQWRPSRASDLEDLFKVRNHNIRTSLLSGIPTLFLKSDNFWGNCAIPCICS